MVLSWLWAGTTLSCWFISILVTACVSCWIARAISVNLSSIFMIFSIPRCKNLSANKFWETKMNIQMQNPNFSKQITWIKQLWSIFLKAIVIFTVLQQILIQFLSDITSTTNKESNYKNQNRIYQFSQQRLLFKCLKHIYHQISTSIQSGHTRIECKWISEQNLICIMTQNRFSEIKLMHIQSCDNQIFQKFSFHNQMHIMTRYNAY